MNTTREDLVKALVEEAGFTGPTARIHLEVFLDVLTKALARGPAVALKGFGILYTAHRHGHPGHNFQTGARIPIPPHYKVTFHPSPVLMKRINDSRNVNG